MKFSEERLEQAIIESPEQEGCPHVRAGLTEPGFEEIIRL